MHVPLRLSMEDPEPLYAQVESQLRDRILAGILTPGTRLPTIRALARQLDCGMNTTRRAYQDLEAEGFILTRQGRGTTVAELVGERISAYRRRAARSTLMETYEAGMRAGLKERELAELSAETLREAARKTEGGKEDTGAGRGKE